MVEVVRVRGKAKLIVLYVGAAFRHWHALPDEAAAEAEAACAYA